MSKNTLNMYLLLFKKPSEKQVALIRETFSEFDWSMGFAVEEVVVDDLLNSNLLIQFVSSKAFFELDSSSNELTLFPTTVEAVVTGKGQFLGTLRNLGQGIEELETFFIYLGEASENRNVESEIIYKVKYDKYSDLIKIDTRLEVLLNS
jgi:hypothetical protein